MYIPHLILMLAQMRPVVFLDLQVYGTSMVTILKFFQPLWLLYGFIADKDRHGGCDCG